MTRKHRPDPTSQLADAVATVVADFRAEDPARADLPDADIVAETVAELGDDDISTLLDEGDMSPQVADAYRAVLAASPEQLAELTHDYPGTGDDGADTLAQASVAVAGAQHAADRIEQPDNAGRDIADGDDAGCCEQAVGVDDGRGAC
jgi:hypothetical protein